MYYILYGIVTLGIVGGIFVFYISTFKFLREMWKEGGGNRVIAIFLGFLLLCLLFYVYKFLEIGYNAFF